ncbi:HEAT repeat domain-containing protein [Svornostia abyssi]|uniref:HEAT repeat domain-containing protein n=1 Tax=Svornostia abyssi TaxID=2898438 RepID=A0ABY5PFT7_9ACTN|nr:HEAT repeat domain-containing protein [Parviterribacteraceae bacterium J379]
MADVPTGRARRRLLRRVGKVDVVETTDGWLVDVEAPRRLAAVRTLAPVPGDDVQEALLARLTDPMDDVRAAAVSALAERDCVRAAERCAVEAPGWDAEGFPAARAAAWALLADCGAAADAIPFTAALLATAHGHAVDPATLDALDALVAGDPEVLRGSLGRAAQALGDADAGVAARALELVSRLGARDPAPLTAALRDDRRAASAAAALGRIGDLSQTPALVALLEPHRPPAVRAAGAAALGELGGAAAARALIRVAEDPDPGVRRAATTSLSGLAGLVAQGQSAAFPEPQTERAADPEVRPEDPDPGEFAPPDDFKEDIDEPDVEFDFALEDDLDDLDDDVEAASAGGTVAAQNGNGNVAAATLTESDAAPAEDDEPVAQAVMERPVSRMPTIVPRPGTQAPDQADDDGQVATTALEDAPGPAAATPVPQVKTALEPAEVEDPPDAPWRRETPAPPVPAGPPPRPRGARRPKGRRR